MKQFIKTIGIILIVCAVIVGAVIAVKDHKARIPEISVKEYSILAEPGDTVDTNALVDIKVKGDYDYKCEIEYGQDSCEMDESGILRIIDNGQRAMSTISLEYVVTGSAGKSCSESVHIIVRNPIGPKNSYEAEVSGVRFRVYNYLQDQGNGVFKHGDGFSDSDYEIVFHSAENVSSLGGLETEIKKYAKEKYLMDEETADYTSEDVVLSSGKKARKITFATARSQGEYLALGESGGLISNVVVYAFGEDGRYFFIDDSSTWGADYEMEQIANTVGLA